MRYALVAQEVVHFNRCVLAKHRFTSKYNLTTWLDINSLFLEPVVQANIVKSGGIAVCCSQLEYKLLLLPPLAGLCSRLNLLKSTAFANLFPALQGEGGRFHLWLQFVAFQRQGCSDLQG